MCGMSELYALPEGWEWKKLGDITKTTSGGTPKRNEKSYWNGQIGWLKSGELNDAHIMHVEEYITEVGLQKSSAKLFPKGTLLIAMYGATVGKLGILDIETTTNQAICGILNDKNLFETKYMFYFLRNIRNKMLIDSTGGAQPNLSQTYIKNLDIPLPPLQEQKRIVAKLDSLFAKIDQAIALHQQNIDEADALMGSVLNEVFGELEENYAIDNIGNMIEVLTDYHSNGAYKTLKANVELLDEENYALMIRATDLEHRTYTKNVKFITEKAYNFMSKSKVYGGEIILPKIGTIGNVYFMPYLERPISLAMNLFMIRCSDNVDNKYLYSFLKSPKGHTEILSRANGAVTKTITKDAVKSIKLPLPPLKTQQKTVQYLDQLSQKTETLKQVQQEKMQSLIALKASILDRAFRGEL